MSTIITIAAVGAAWTAIAAIAILSVQKKQPNKHIKLIDPRKANPPIPYHL